MTTQRYEFRDASELEDLETLLAQVSTFSSIASFVIDGDPSKYSSWAHALVDEIRADLLDIESDTNRWPGSINLTTSDATRYLFRLTPTTSSLLQRSAGSLFEWHNPRLPEDLHFLRSDRSLFLGNIALEKYAWMELSPEEFDRWSAFDAFSVTPSPSN